jgi:hypothetical protein
MQIGDRVKLSVRAKREDCRSSSAIRKSYTEHYGNSIGTIICIYQTKHRPITVIWENTTRQGDRNGLAYDIYELELA